MKFKIEQGQIHREYLVSVKRVVKDCFQKPIYVGRTDVVLNMKKRKYFLVEKYKQGMFCETSL